MNGESSLDFYVDKGGIFISVSHYLTKGFVQEKLGDYEPIQIRAPAFH